MHCTVLHKKLSVQCHFHKTHLCFFKQQPLDDQIHPPPANNMAFWFCSNTNTSSDNALATALHTIPLQLEQQGAYAWLLLADYSTALNTIIHTGQVSNPGFEHISLWMKEFQTD